MATLSLVGDAGPRAWGCDGKISGEHVVSRSVFIAPTVRVHGFAWCKDAAKEVGVGSITAKVLCARHNSALAPLDTAAGNAFQMMRDALALSQKRTKLLAWEIPELVRFTIDAPLLERWLLKTLLNLYVGSANRIGRYGTGPGRFRPTWSRSHSGALRFPVIRGCRSLRTRGCSTTSTTSSP